MTVGEETPNKPLEWNRFCYVANHKKSYYKLYWNNEVSFQRLEGPDRLRKGGIFILGQDQDELGGGYNFRQSINAVVGSFNVFTREITSEEAKDFTNCQENFRSESFINFKDFENKWTISGSVNKTEIEVEKICKKNNFKLMIFPERRVFKNSETLCHNFKGTLYAPGNEAENQEISSLINPFLDTCIDTNGNAVNLGVKISKDGRYEYYNNGTEVSFHSINEKSGKVEKGKEFCLQYSVTKGIAGSWFATSKCDSLPSCTICRFDSFILTKVMIIIISFTQIIA